MKDKTVKVSPLSSLRKAKLIAETLKSWIENGEFFLTSPVERLPTDTVFNPMRQVKEVNFIESILHKAETCREDDDVKTVAEKIIDRSVNHVVVVDCEGKLKGIVTSWDVTRAVAKGTERLSEIIIRKVYTVKPSDTVESAARVMAHHKISALPVIDSNKRVVGIVTAEDISKLVGK